MNFRILLLFLILFAIDLYVFQGVKVLVQSRTVQTQRIITYLYWTVTVLSLGVILLAQYVDWHTWPKVLRTYSFAIIVIIYLSKILVSIFMLLDDIIRLFRLIGGWISMKFFNSAAQGAETTLRVSRLDFLVKLGFIVGSIPFFSMLYGMVGGAYDYRVRKVKLKAGNLPGSFDGLRVVQISDLHTGSFMGPSQITKAMDLILEQKPDVIFFTGDLVNDRHIEAVEFKDQLSRLKAPMGVYSILGNHDYGDYYRWNTQEEKAENLVKLKNFHGELGWNLLLNSHTYIEKNGEKIGLVGVENWSSRMNFHKYGDMEVAMHGMEPAPFNILLSHDPSHWDAEITSKYQQIDLTLSGHTHGFQFGVEIPGFRWSPVQYVYKKWADLYQEGNQYLYVNRGLGFLGYPGRVGILPEITVFDFQKA